MNDEDIIKLFDYYPGLKLLLLDIVVVRNRQWCEVCSYLMRGLASQYMFNPEEYGVIQRKQEVTIAYYPVSTSITKAGKEVQGNKEQDAQDTKKEDSDTEEVPDIEAIYAMLAKANKKISKLSKEDRDKLQMLQSAKTDDAAQNEEVVNILPEKVAVDPQVENAMNELLGACVEQGENLEMLEQYAREHETRPPRSSLESNMSSRTTTSTLGRMTVSEFYKKEQRIRDPSHTLFTEDHVPYVHTEANFKMLATKSDKIKTQVTTLLYEMQLQEIEKEGLTRILGLKSIQESKQSQKEKQIEVITPDAPEMTSKNYSKPTLRSAVEDSKRTGRRAIVIDAEKQKDLMAQTEEKGKSKAKSKGKKNNASEKVQEEINQTELTEAQVPMYPKRSAKTPQRYTPDDKIKRTQEKGSVEKNSSVQKIYHDPKDYMWESDGDDKTDKIAEIAEKSVERD